MLRLSLRTKIMICCIGVVALLDLMVVIFVRGRLSAELRADCLVKGQNLAGNLAKGAEHLVLTDDVVRLRDRMTELKDNDEDVVYAYVTDRKGQALAHTFAGGFPAGLKAVNVPGPGASSSTMLLDTLEAGLVHDIAVGIIGGKVGIVHVGMSERRIQRTIAHFTTVIVAIAGLVLLIAVGLSAVVSWVVTQPVRDLTEAARQIRDGDLGQQVVATSQDEIGDLVDSFNQMSEELLKQHKVLDDRNRRIRIAREQAAGQRDRLRAIIDSMVEGVVFVNADGNISLCNESAERIWNVSAEELVGKPLLDCHSPEVRPMLENILAQAKRTPGFAAGRTMVGSKGQCRLSNYSSVHGEDGRYLGLVMLSQDISDRVALEQEHRQLREQLFQQEKMVLIGQIAASVAHELNTPLGTVLLRAQMIQHQLADDADLSDVKVLEGEAQRCRRIIDSLLGFSRRSEGVLATTEVDSLIRESLSLIEHDLVLKGITVETVYDTKAAAIRVDGNQIQQVILNLISNASDAMGERSGRLQISTGLVPGQHMVEIRVSDNGSGMSQEVLARAFDAFFTTKERGKGTGLGLAICRRIIEEHQGKIEIQTSPGHGTTVSVRLPHVPVEIPVDE